LIDKSGLVWRCLECGRCAEDSRAKNNLKRHVETHMRDICLPCTVCAHTSSSTNGLLQHIAKKHTQPKAPKPESPVTSSDPSGPVASANSGCQPGGLLAGASMETAGINMLAAAASNSYVLASQFPHQQEAAAMNYSMGEVKHLLGSPYGPGYQGAEYGMYRYQALAQAQAQALPIAASRSIAHAGPHGMAGGIPREGRTINMAEGLARVKAEVVTNLDSVTLEVKGQTRVAVASKEEASKAATASEKEVAARAEVLMERRGEEWVCRECGKAGALWHVRRHVEVHMVDLAFPCKECGKVSRSSHGLYQHMAKQHPEARKVAFLLAKHKCSICGKPSKTSKGLSNHRWKYHRPGLQQEEPKGGATGGQEGEQQGDREEHGVREEQDVREEHGERQQHGVREHDLREHDLREHHDMREQHDSIVHPRAHPQGSQIDPRGLQYDPPNPRYDPQRLQHDPRGSRHDQPRVQHEPPRPLAKVQHEAPAGQHGLYHPRGLLQHPALGHQVWGQ